jgi:hypothetical protein
MNEHELQETDCAYEVGGMPGYVIVGMCFLAVAYILVEFMSAR